MMIYLVWILVGVVGRLVVHVPDVTPLTSLALLAPTVFSKRISIAMMLCILILSDYLLHVFFHYPAFGLWSLFNYSAWIAIVLFGFLFAKKPNFLSALIYTFFSALFFWVWTDFGTWCLSSLYPHTLNGLTECFVMALPFLKYSIVGSLAWTAALMIVKSSRFAKHPDPFFQRG